VGSEMCIRDRYMAYMICSQFQELFPNNEEAELLMSDIILNLAISLY